MFWFWLLLILIISPVVIEIIYKIVAAIYPAVARIKQNSNAKIKSGDTEDGVYINDNGEWWCPVCDYKNVSGNVCKSCGYVIRNFKGTALKSTVSPANPPISTQSVNSRRGNEAISIRFEVPTQAYMYSDCTVHIVNKPELKKLIEKYTTDEYDDNFINDYKFLSVKIGHEYSDYELSEKLKYLVFHKLWALSSCKRYVNETVNADKFFGNFDDVLIISKDLSDFEQYFDFEKPVPHEVYIDYSSNREKYTNDFIERWWKATLNNASDLKTDDGKIKRIDKKYSDLLLYRNYLTENNIHFLNQLKDNFKIDDIKRTLQPLPVFREEPKKDYIISKTDLYNKVLKDAERLNFDLVEAVCHSYFCGECAKYVTRVYSISGNDIRFPKLPDYIKSHECECDIMLYLFSDGVNYMTDPYTGNTIKGADVLKYSNRPFVDDRPQKWKDGYDNMLKKIKQEKIDEENRKQAKIEYIEIATKLPDIAPKSLNGYSRMKNLNSENFQELKEQAIATGIEIKDLVTEINE